MIGEDMVPLGRKKIALIAGAVALIIFVIVFVAGTMRGGSAAPPPQRIDPSTSTTGQSDGPTAEPEPTFTQDSSRMRSVVEDATGETYAGNAYQPNRYDVELWAKAAVGYTPSERETRQSWEERMDRLFAFTPQDFPRELVMTYAPPASEWDAAWSRELVVNEATKIQETTGQGGVPFESWSVLGHVIWRDGDGNVMDKGSVEMMLTVQCVTDRLSTCRLLGVSAKGVQLEWSR